MADNYLERRAEELRSGGRTVVRRNTPSLDTLLLKNRSHRGFDSSYVVAMRQLMAIVSVNDKIPSGHNAQTLRFKLVDADSGGRNFCRFLRFGAFLKELNLPESGSEPQAFIVVCSVEEESPRIDIDLGISLQSMALKAVEIGLNVLIVRSMDHQGIKDALGLPYEPIAVLAIGKGTDKIEIDSVSAGSDLHYYRRDGIHHVPKLRLEDLLL